MTAPASPPRLTDEQELMLVRRVLNLHPETRNVADEVKLAIRKIGLDASRSSRLAAERAEEMARALLSVTTCSHRKWERTDDNEFVCGLCITLARAALAAYRGSAGGGTTP